MPIHTVPRPIRLAPDEWEIFKQFQAELQRRTPHATVTARDAFRVAVGSASVALARGEITVALSHEPAPISDPREGRTETA